MAILFGYQLIVCLAPWTLQVTPWGLTNAGSSTGMVNSVATALAQLQSYRTWPITNHRGLEVGEVRANFKLMRDDQEQLSLRAA